MAVFTELKQRGVTDCVVACVEGLTGVPDALETIFPRTQVPLCMVQTVRHALRDVVWRERRAVARDLRALDGASPVTEADAALERFALTWDAHDPTISPSWRRDGTRLTVFVDDPPAMRTVLYPTKAMESLNASFRTTLNQRRAFPTDDASRNVLSRGLQRIATHWTAPIPEWKRARTQVAMIVGDRVPTID